MKKSTRIWLIVAAVLLLTGGMLFAGTMAVAGFDFSSLSTQSYTRTVWEIREDFHSITVETDTMDVTVAPSQDGICRLEWYDEESLDFHSAELVDGVLTIIRKDDRPWTERIGITYGESPRLTVYLPKASYEALEMNVTTGDVQVPGGFAFEAAKIRGTTADVVWGADVSGDLTVLLTTGDTELKSCTLGSGNLYATTGNKELADVTCGELNVKGDTGSLEMTRVIAERSIRAEVTTGAILMNGVDAGELDLKTTTGSVTGTLLSPKIFLTEVTTGKIRVPHTTDGGICNIRTTTGDIQIELS